MTTTLGCIQSVGIDGCKGGWVAVALSRGKVEVVIHENIAEICQRYNTANSIIIDMPIGLPEKIEDMRPDKELREYLKGKASSVFSTPCRQAVYAPDYTQAIEENKRVLGLSISPLTYAIVPKIREIDIFLTTNPEWQNRLVESHPEYCFALLNKNKPVFEKKKTSIGVKTRLALLSEYYEESHEVVEQFQKNPGSASKTDDVIDALVLSVIGILGLRFGFTTLPEEPRKDAKGLYMQIIGARI